MKTPKERYYNDPHFAALVNMMVAHIEKCDYTPSEMREAAILASIIHEQMRIKPYYPLPKDIELHLTKLHEWTR